MTDHHKFKMKKSDPNYHLCLKCGRPLRDDVHSVKEKDEE